MNASRTIGASFLAALALGTAGAQAGIVASWDFEEAGGDTVFDGAGSNNATIGAGAGSRVATGDFGGKLGQSWSSSEAEVLTAPYTNQYDSLTSMSTESWVKWNGGGVANYWLTINVPFSTFIHTGVPGIRFIMGGVDSAYLPLDLVKTDTWQQWVTTYDAGSGTMKVYLDAVEVFSGSGGTGLNWGGAVADRLGLNSGGTFNDGVPVGGAFQGLVDHLSIHDTALTQEQVQARYDLIVPEPGLLGVMGLGFVLALASDRRRRGRL